MTKFLSSKKEGKRMKMKNRIIEYMETCEISFDSLSDALDIDRNKFEKNNKQDWNAEELLKVCAYLQIDPWKFYEKRIG